MESFDRMRYSQRTDETYVDSRKVYEEKIPDQGKVTKLMEINKIEERREDLKN